MEPLRPIGVDIPTAPQRTVDATQQLPAIDVTPLQTLSQANQRGAQTVAAASQANQQIAQSNEAMWRTTAQNAQQVSQVTAQIAQMDAAQAQQSAQSIAGFTNSVLQVVNQYQQMTSSRDAALRKQIAEAQKAAAISELENVRIDWIEKGHIDKAGTMAYRDTIAKTVGKYELGAEDVASLTEKYYSPALEYAKTTEENRQSKVREMLANDRKIISLKLGANLSASLAALSESQASTPQEVERLTTNVNEQIRALVNNPRISLEDTTYAVAVALEAFNKSLDSRNIAASRMRNTIEASRTLTQYAAQQAQLLRSDQITKEQYDANIRQKALEVNYPGFDAPDPNASLKFVNETNQLAVSMQENAQKRAEFAIVGVEADNAIIGGLATEFAINPASYAAVLNKPDKMRNANEKLAIQQYEAFVKWRDNDVPQYNARQAAWAAEMNNISAANDKWFVGALRDARNAQNAPSFNGVMQTLRGFDPNLAGVIASKPQLTQEDVTLMSNAFLKQLEGVKQQAYQSQRDYNNRVAEFEKLGLSLDATRLKAYNQSYRTKIEQYRQQQEQLRIQSTQYPAIPPVAGEDPNFRGGNPGKPLSWKPLARASYGGSTLTMPFGQDALASLEHYTPGKGFRAARSNGRTHNALDFTVPTGTPTTSLVYGTVRKVSRDGEAAGYGIRLEVVGDNGYVYHYAHLSKTLAVSGQRVAPGDVVALTGNTDGGMGISTGPHLHLDIMDSKGNIVDPMLHLAANTFGSGKRQSRQASSGRPTAAPPIIPQGAIPLGGNTYLYQGRVVSAEYVKTTQFDASKSTLPPQWSTTRPIPASNRRVAPGQLTTPRVTDMGAATYSISRPIRNSASSGTRSTTLAPDSHGYSVLANDPPFTQALNRLAVKHGINPEVFADLMATETAGTFDPAIPNGSGHYGLIQFGPAAMRDLGVTEGQLRGMTRLQQLTLVDRYLDLQKQYAGISGKFNGVAEAAAAVLAGHTELRAIRRGATPSGEVQTYIDTFGKYVGRRYDFRGNRRRRASTVIHTSPSAGCAMCSQMQAFYPHESQDFLA